MQRTCACVGGQALNWCACYGGEQRARAHFEYAGLHGGLLHGSKRGSTGGDASATMCHGMGLTASAVGERITLVWSLSQLLRELDLTSLSGLFGVTAAIITRHE